MHINYFEGGEYQHGHVIIHDGVPGGEVGVPGGDSRTRPDTLGGSCLRLSAHRHKPLDFTVVTCRVRGPCVSFSTRPTSPGKVQVDQL